MSGAGSQKVDQTPASEAVRQTNSDYNKCSRSTESFGSRETNFHLAGGGEGSLDCFSFSFIERMKFWLTSDWLGGLEQFSQALSLCFLNNNK